MTLSLENQVCDKEYAIQLRDLRVPQDSLFYWVKRYNSNGKTYCVILSAKECLGLSKDNIIACAYTASELGELLPKDCLNGVLEIEKHLNNWSVNYVKPLPYHFSYIEGFNVNTLPNAMAKMLIYLLQNHLINLSKE